MSHIWKALLPLYLLLEISKQKAAAGTRVLAQLSKLTTWHGKCRESKQDVSWECRFLRERRHLVQIPVEQDNHEEGI